MFWKSRHFHIRISFYRCSIASCSGVNCRKKVDTPWSIYRGFTVKLCIDLIICGLIINYENCKSLLKQACKMRIYLLYHKQAFKVKCWNFVKYWIKTTILAKKSNMVKYPYLGQNLVAMENLYAVFLLVYSSTGPLQKYNT